MCAATSTASPTPERRGGIVTAKADVRDLEGLRAALQRGVDELGRPDVVVANAGISGVPSPAALIEESDWQAMLDINLTGVMHTAKVALPHMSDGRGGSIILVNSIHPGNGHTPMLDNEWFRRTMRPDLAEPTMADAAQVIGHFTCCPSR